MTETAVHGWCPLCGAGTADPILEVERNDVWRRLEQDWGLRLSDPVRAANSTTATVTMVRCTECGLDRFDPLEPGGPDFYEELMSAMPYARARWDFAVARRRIVAAHDVADLGCGDGRFLLSLGSRTGRTVGVDHHEGAVRRLKHLGAEGYAVPFATFAQEEAGRFDVVTSFHTLEHVPDPVGMFRAAMECVRPGGLLLVSMPNRERTWREEGEPLDRPPHHVTRWGPAQLRRLAGADGVRLEHLWFEPPGPRQAASLAEDGMRRRVARWPAPLRAASARGAWLAGATLALAEHRRLGLGYARRGVYGHTMMAAIRRI